MSRYSEPLNPASTELLLAGFLPDLWQRSVAIRQLVDSAEHARFVAPDAWGVTLHRDLFRLNVGRVEVLVVGAGFIRVNCLGSAGTPPFAGPRYEPQDYQSVPVPHVAYFGPIDEYPTVQAELRRPHHHFIEQVGRTRTGEPVSGSPHRRSHSDALITYARNLLEQAPPQFVAPDELNSDFPLMEGATSKIIVNAYERNSEARTRCIEAHGTSCGACGMDFGAVYGPEIGGYIHVHHLRPLSEIGTAYVVDPVRDLRPVCPNCHAVIHHGGSLRSIDDVKRLLAKQRSNTPRSS